MPDRMEPEPPEDDATPPSGNVISSQSTDPDETYVVDLIESVRRDRAVLSRAKRLGFLRSGG
jgi:hypothetical protein